MTTLILVLAAGAQAQSLDIVGTCPGPATVTLDGMTPNGRVAIAAADASGSFVLPGSPCVGTELDLEPATAGLLKIVEVNGAGTRVLRPELGAASCGKRIQAVDLATCTPTPAACTTDLDGDGICALEDVCDACPAGLVAWWTFEGDVTDASGNGHDGALSGGSFVAGVHGQALTLSGAEHATIPHHPDFDQTRSLSAAAWINPDSTGGNPGVFSKAPRGGPVQDWGFYQSGTGLGVDVNFPSAEQFIASGALGLSVGTWTHVAWVIDVDGGEIRYYTNGSLATTVAYSTPVLAVGTDGLIIGSDGGAPNDWSGQIDDLSFWSTALSDADVAWLFANTL